MRQISIKDRENSAYLNQSIDFINQLDNQFASNTTKKVKKSPQRQPLVNDYNFALQLNSQLHSPNNLKFSNKTPRSPKNQKRNSRNNFQNTQTGGNSRKASKKQKQVISNVQLMQVSSQQSKKRVAQPTDNIVDN